MIWYYFMNVCFTPSRFYATVILWTGITEQGRLKFWYLSVSTDWIWSTTRSVFLCSQYGIETNHMTIQRVKIVAYLGLVIDENLYWNAHVDFVCTSLVKLMFYHIKSFITWPIARQLYFALVNSRINYGIEVYGHCADEHLSKFQTLQNELLKLLLKLDRYCG